MSEVTQEQFEALEKAHGAGMVRVLTVADEDFAFRVPTKNDVALLIDASERKVPSALEECAMRCLLCPAVPTANRGTVEGSEEKAAAAPAPQELVAERQRLQARYAQSEFYRDWIAKEFLASVGHGWRVEDPRKLTTGQYEITCISRSDESERVTLVARKMSAAHYAAYRRSIVEHSTDSAAICWKACIVSVERDGVASRLPILVETLESVLVSLGTDGGTVAVKKFGNGPAPQPGTSTLPPAGGAR